MNQIILNFLDRMIDESIKNAEALSAMKSAITEQRTDIGEIKTEINNIFEKERDILQDIKDRIESTEERQEHKNHCKNVEKFIDQVRSPKTWVALGVSFIVAISAIIGGVATIVYRLPEWANKSNSVVQHQKTDSKPIIP